MSITAEKLQEIRERADIVQIIGRVVELKKRGQRHLGLCPFHGEKTPSFSVSADKGLYYCFGCHAGGDVFAFIMRHRGVDFQSAVRDVAQSVGVELAPESETARRRRSLEAELSHVNEYALAFFEHALWAPGGDVARRYLAERAIPEEQAREQKLGFGAGRGELVRYLAAKKVKREVAMRAGLLTEDGERCLFDGRLVFPIGDGHGHLAGFGGRRLGEGAGPKYINTRESPLFSKRQLLYGWQEASGGILKAQEVVIVEGYLDVLACQRAGVTNAVAALGTALTEEHAHRCARVAKRALLLLDADAAGERASHEAAIHLLRAGLKVLLAPLPKGEDPDSVVRKQGARAFKKLLSEPRPAIEVFIERAFADAAAGVEARAEQATRVAPLLAALGDGLERELYLARLAERVGLSSEQLERHLRRAIRRAPRAAAATTTTTQASQAPTPLPAPPAINPGELRLACELLLYPHLRPQFAELSEYATHEVTRQLLEALADPQTSIEEAVTAAVPDATWQRKLLGVVPVPMDTEEDKARAARTLSDALRRLKLRHLDAILAEVVEQLQASEAHSEEIEALMRRKQDLTRRRNAMRRGE